ncbi:MAG: DUF3124 domain-containing protein [Rhodothermales bacterium]|nr:DUF3124 domain-containing protein [Rhodothermales bacterium]
MHECGAVGGFVVPGPAAGGLALAARSTEPPPEPSPEPPPGSEVRAEARIAAVRYYDSEGQLVRRFLDAPLALGPMASTEFVIGDDDLTGGAGAKFIVTWSAETEVTEPVVEAVMIGTTSQLGISFTSPGRVLRDRPHQPPPP